MKAAEHFIAMAEKEELGQRWYIVGSVIFSAFAIEAFINHVGEINDESWIAWDKKERPCVRDKLKRLNVKLETTDCYFIDYIFSMLNSFAHGKTATIKKKIRRPQNNIVGAIKDLLPEYEKELTPQKVKSIVSDTKNIISTINKLSLKLSRQKLWSIGHGSLRTNA
jgi:hypothetical protein